MKRLSIIFLACVVFIAGRTALRAQESAFFDVVTLNRFLEKLRVNDEFDKSVSIEYLLMNSPTLNRIQALPKDDPNHLDSETYYCLIDFINHPFHPNTYALVNAKSIRDIYFKCFRSAFEDDIEEVIDTEREKSKSLGRDDGPVTKFEILLKQSISSSSHPETASGVPLSIESRLIYATADIIAQRFQEELSLAFFNKFSTALENDSFLGTLFPNTKEFLVTILSTPLSIPSLGQSWRAAYEEDLKKLPEHLRSYFEGQGTFKESDELRILVGALETIYDLKNGKHPSQIIRALAQKSEGRDERSKLQMVVAFLDRISRNLTTPDGNGWLRVEQLRTLEEKTSMKYFVGYLYQQDTELFHQMKIDSKQIATVLHSLQHQLQMFISLTSTIERKIELLRDSLRQGKSPTFGEYVSYARMVFDIIKFGYNLARLNGMPSKFDVTFKTIYVPLAEQTLQALETAERREYGATLVHVLGILSRIDKDAVIKPKARSALIKYGSFMADVVAAKTVEETKKALESVILPAGSYSVKRESSFTLGVNAYGGGTFGWEQVQNDDGTFGDRKNHVGLFAPVGIELAFGMKCGLMQSFSALISLLDLGSVVNFRLGNKTESVPNIGFAQVFAPGLYGVLGLFEGVPLSIGFGAQFNPNLRDITKEGDVVRSDVNTFRASLFLAVDIPLFNLVTLNKDY